MTVEDVAAAGAVASVAVPSGGTSTPRRIAARVRIDLPRYRVRGLCGIFWSGDGVLRIEFDHSSLFGAVREEATVLIRGEGIEIRDERDGTAISDGEALAMLSDHLGLPVHADDLLYLLLLRPLRLDGQTPVTVRPRGDDLIVRGSWRGRTVEFEGPPGMPPRRLLVVSPGGAGYETRYRYPDGLPDGYPERVVLERIGGGGRISLTVEEAAAGRE